MSTRYLTSVQSINQKHLIPRIFRQTSKTDHYSGETYLLYCQCQYC